MQYNVEYNGDRHKVTRTWSCLFGFVCVLRSYRKEVHVCFEASNTAVIKEFTSRKRGTFYLTRRLEHGYEK